MPSVDLSLLQPPEVIESLSFELILSARKDRFIDLAPDLAPVMELESEPAVKLLEEASYDELLLRNRINVASYSVMLAYATGNSLEHLAALYGVTRLITDPGNPDAIPPVPPVFETDTALRARVQMAPEGFSTAGPSGAYRFHAISASGQALDASVDSPRFASLALSPEQAAILPANTIALTCTYDAGLPSPRPGMVRVCVLSNVASGEPDAELLNAVRLALNAEDIRPLTDELVVTAPEIIEYVIEASLVTYPGPSAQAVLAAAQSAVARYAENTHRIGYDVTRSGIYAALHQPGVQKVNLIHPAADVTCDVHQASYCTAATITLAGTDV